MSAQTLNAPMMSAARNKLNTSRLSRSMIEHDNQGLLDPAYRPVYIS